MLTREFSLTDAELGDGRTLVLACVPFDVEAPVDDLDGYGPYLESFRRGAFSHVVKSPHRTELRYAHREDSLPYGFGVDLIEDPSHLIGRFRVAPGDQGDQLLALVGDDQLKGVSIGFFDGVNDEQVRGGIRHVARIRVKRLSEVSLVPAATFAGAKVLAVREAGDALPDLGAIERERIRWQRLRLAR